MVQEHAATSLAQAEHDAIGTDLLQFVNDEFDAFLKCGILAYGFPRLRWADGGHDKLIAFNCNLRGIFPACGAWHRPQRTGWHTSSRTS